jgi:hypothetical protein
MGKKSKGIELKTPKIEEKPKYCHAWVSKVSDKVMCNTITCCGYAHHGLKDRVTNGFMRSVNENGEWFDDPHKLEKVGSHPLVDGKFMFNDGTFHDPNKTPEQYKKDIEEIHRKVDEEMREKFGDYMNDSDEEDE